MIRARGATYLGGAQNISLTWGIAVDGTVYVSVFAVRQKRFKDEPLWIAHDVYFWDDHALSKLVTEDKDLERLRWDALPRGA